MILCITHSGDYYTIDLVMKAIAEAGYHPFRLDTDRLNHQIPFGFDNSGGAFSKKVMLPGWPADPTAIKAVWNRKIWPISVPEDLDAGYTSIFCQEYETVRNILLAGIRDMPWMNPEYLDREVAANKLGQLELAANFGLNVPATLFTNDSEQLSRFFHEKCAQKMIAKLHGVLSVSMLGSGLSFPTTLITEKELVGLPEQLPYCPMIFQQYIPKIFELRIAYVDGIYFAGKINTGGSLVDWRQQPLNDQSWQPFELPDPIKQKIDQLMRHTGLLFGMLDMIVTPDNDYVFLEVNPKGEWGMLQKFLQYPIAETIVQQLLSKIQH